MQSIPPKSNVVIYYVTDDLHNTREYNEIQLLNEVARVVIVSQPGSGSHPLGLRQVRASVPCGRRASWLQSWARMSFLLCRVGQGEIDRRFPERNLFTGGALFRRMVNSFWSIKSAPLISRLLPNYSSLFFSPFRIAQLWRHPKAHARRYQRVVVFDSVLNRVAHFAPFIESQRQRGAVLVANVKSWDNAFYARLATEADGFLVWSPSIWQDLQNTHRLRSSRYIAWGARSFFDFQAQSPAISAVRPRASDAPFTLGYAAAYAHPRMAYREAQVIAEVSRQLQLRWPGMRLLFRPYPTLNPEVYEVLRSTPGVEIHCIEGAPQDRFGDGREVIRFGSSAEKLAFLEKCDVYLSLATSFTFEAMLVGCPILQLALAPSHRQSTAEKEIFRWVDISDHLQSYFMRELPLAHSYADVVAHLQQLEVLKANSMAATQRLTHRLRLPGAPQQPAQAELVQQLNRFFSDLCSFAPPAGLLQRPTV